ncbi:MAG: hypothetical protein MJ219_02260 [Mycoplasmoidaceae bacterium]|nr:hypothetical protein [Mycoplasmoidaceae bacterium]
MAQIGTIPDLLTYVKEQYNSLPAVVKSDNTTATFNDLYKDVLKIAGSIQNYKGNIGLLANNSY